MLPEAWGAKQIMWLRPYVEFNWSRSTLQAQASPQTENKDIETCGLEQMSIEQWGLEENCCCSLSSSGINSNAETELEAKQQEVDRLVAEVEVLKKRKREQDQGSDNITVASSQWRWREGSRRGRRGQGDLSVEARGTCPYPIPFKGNWNKREWILPG